MREVEEKFLQEAAQPIFNEYKKEVVSKILDNEEKLKNQILNTLQSIAQKANEKNGYEVKYIDFSLLQIGFLNETYEVTAIAYDENWYADEGIWEILSIDYIFDGLKAIRAKLYQDIKKYVGKIRPSCIDQYILKQISSYNTYFSYFLIKWLKQWDEEISFKEMPKSEVLQVIWGDYKNYYQKVYYYDSSTKTEEMFKEKLQNAKQEEIVFTMWTGLKVNTFKIENKDISCMSLKQSDLKNIYFSSCTSLGLNLKEANLKKCYFRNCDLGASDFTESFLEEVVFENCILRNTKFNDAKFKNVYLSNGKKMINVLKEEDLLYQIC